MEDVTHGADDAEEIAEGLEADEEADDLGDGAGGGSVFIPPKPPRP